MASRRWRKRQDSSLISSQGVPPESARRVYIDESKDSNATKQPSSAHQHDLVQTSGKKTLGIVWYKWNDLRVKDHEPLLRAHGLLQESKLMFVKPTVPDDVIHLHIVELPLLTGKARLSGLPRCSRQRARFWKQCVKDLASTFQQLSQESINSPEQTSIRGQGQGNISGQRNCADDTERQGNVLESPSRGVANGASFFVQSGQDASVVLQEFIEERKLLEKYDKITVFAHQEFCTEELSTEKRVRKCLQHLSHKVGKPLQLATYWGALTVTHIDDLGFDPAGEEMPLYKGEFNRLGKSKRLRPVLSVPRKLKPAPEVVLAGSTDEQIDAIFSLHEEAMVSFERESDMELVVARSQNAHDAQDKSGPDKDEFSLVVAETSSYGTAFLDGSFEWQGGERQAQTYLDLYFGQGKSSGKDPRLWSYRGATESFAHGEDLNPLFAGTRLSPWLAFGCISAREVVQRARDCERQTGKKGGGKSVGKAGSTGARLHTELLFRDFLRFSALKWGSSLFLQHGPFHLGETPSETVAWQGIDDIQIAQNELSKSFRCSNRMRFRKWRLGQTGFPFVDAGMRQLLHTGYMSHLHRQCCAAFLVRDLKLDWRLGAEHFESCLVDYTPDANWGNWAYRILQRPCLAKSRNETKYSNRELLRMGFEDTTTELANSVDSLDLGSRPISKKPKRDERKLTEPTSDGRRVVDCHLSTIECVAWPVVHDCRMQHTLTWIPELRSLPKDLAREPWRRQRESSTGSRATKLSVMPYKDSPLWFCAANRTNWHYEYWWLPGGAWLAPFPEEEPSSIGYPAPLVRPVNLEISLSNLPVRNHAWGDTSQGERRHVHD